MIFLATLMADPVVASDGFTYERKSIEDWMEGHDVSPTTNQPLEHIHNPQCHGTQADCSMVRGEQRASAHAPKTSRQDSGCRRQRCSTATAKARSDVSSSLQGAAASVLRELRLRRVFHLRLRH